MLRESNCSILSWLQSDIYYFKNEQFISEAKELGKIKAKQKNQRKRKKSTKGKNKEK